jgi:arylsulfatase A-like enzyme
MLENHPHIVLFLTDQQRFDTVAAWGHSHMITPSMDRLARAGVSFRQAFCPGATCIASRAAMFTGMYPHTTGVYTFQSWADHRTWVQDLADAGYFCANIGKMHFSPRDVSGGFQERVVVENPTNLALANGGADDDWGRFLTLHGHERPNFRNRTDPDWMKKLQGVSWHLEEHFHSDVFIGDSAVNWIRNFRGTGPVFLEVGLTGPHEPWDPLPRHLELYDGRPVPPRVLREGELEEKPPQQRTHQRWNEQTEHESVIRVRSATEGQIEHMKRHYFAKITTVDEQIGKVLDALEAKGWLRDSLLIFCSDHGELLGDHDMAYKWLMYEPIVHVPLVIRTPAGSMGAPAGSEVQDLVSLMDLGPTILEAAGVPAPTYLEGRSLGPYLRSEPIEPRRFVCCEDNYQIMYRTPNWKMVYYIGQEQGELYDLSGDPNELVNLWDDPGAAETKIRLTAGILEWMAASNYWNSGYKRGEGAHYRLRWPADGDYGLHGGGRNGREKPLPYL